MKIAIVGALWANNYGDVLLAKLLKDKLVSLGHSIILPNATTKIRNELDLGNVNHTYLNDVDYVLFCGGGYFSEPPGNSVKWALSRTRALFKYAVWCKAKKIPYSIIGVGAGPLNSFFSRFIVRRVCIGSEIVLARDTISYDTIKGLSPKIKLEQVSDLVLSLKDLYEDIDSKSRKTDTKRKIGIHITCNASDVIIPILNYIESHFDEYDFTLIEDNPGEYQRLCTAYPNVKSLLKNKLEYSSVDQFTIGISNFDAVITSKLHVGIVAAAFNKVICSLPYHAKVERLYSDLGRSELVLNRFEDKNEISAHIEECLKSQPVSIPEELIASSRRIWHYIDAEFGGGE